MAELKYKDITKKILGASFEVHSFLGNGFQEVIYQRALSWEMTQVGLTYAREIEQKIFYKNLAEPIGTRRADFVVEEKVLVELKAVIELKDVAKYYYMGDNVVKALDDVSICIYEGEFVAIMGPSGSEKSTG